MRTRVIVLILFVCVPFSSSIRRLYRILNMAIGFTLHLKDFQLTDFAEKASFVSYTNSDFSQYTAAILACLRLSVLTILYRLRKMTLCCVMQCSVCEMYRYRYMYHAVCAAVLKFSVI